MGDVPDDQPSTPSGVSPDCPPSPPLLHRQATSLLDGTIMSRGDYEGNGGGSPPVLHEVGDSGGGDGALRVRNLLSGTRRTYGPVGSRPAVRARNPPTGDCEPGPNYVDSLSPWDRELAFYSGRLRGVEAVNFRHGVYMGALRLWQDFGREASVARRILADGDGTRMDGFLRWARYHRNRRLLRCASAALGASFVPASALPRGVQGDAPGGDQSDDRGSDGELSAGRNVRVGEESVCVVEQTQPLP